MTDEKPRVLIAILNTGDVRTETIGAAFEMVRDPRYRVALMLSNEWCAANNRNIIVQKAKAMDPRPDFLLMMDDDVKPSSNLLDLVEEDKDIVGFLTPIWRVLSSPHDPVICNVWVEGEGGAFVPQVVDIDRDGPLMRCAGVGTSAMLIAMRVFDRLDAPFQDVYGEHGVLAMTEDLAFCRRARAAGFEVWASLDHSCGHIKRVDINDVFLAIQYWKRLATATAVEFGPMQEELVPLDIG